MKKIIHYFYDNVNIWEKNNSPMFRMCYASWLKFCPDYEIKLWHTDMPEFKEILKKSKFVRLCYKYKLWAFIADYIRHYACYNYGGIYLDTDVQLLNNFDKFLSEDFFVSIEGDIINGENIPETAVMGGEKGNLVSKKMLEIYDSDEIFTIDYLIAPIVLKKALKNEINFKTIQYTNEKYNKIAEEFYNDANNTKLTNYELYRNQEIYKNKELKISIYPSEYFCPSWTAFGEKAFTDKTIAVHWNQSSWWENISKLKLLQSYRYKNPIKRYIYRNNERYVKILTFFIPNKKLRKKIRKKLVDKFYKYKK